MILQNVCDSGRFITKNIMVHIVGHLKYIEKPFRKLYLLPSSRVTVTVGVSTLSIPLLQHDFLMSNYMYFYNCLQQMSVCDYSCLHSCPQLMTFSVAEYTRIWLEFPLITLLSKLTWVTPWNICYEEKLKIITWWYLEIFWFNKTTFESV
jgi:hypothetical protein